MTSRSADVDAYIANAAEFARPILNELRKAFHDADPEIEEVMKWRFLHFEHNGIVGSMAAFKQHVSWGFWKAQLMDTDRMSKVSSVDQLPAHKKLVAMIREAVQLNEQGVKVSRPARKKNDAAVEVPAELAAALKKNKKAKVTFDAFPPSHRREYAQWVGEAKQEATRQKRVATAIEWLAEGKPRNWKYMK